MLRLGIVSGILHPQYGGPVTVIRSHVQGLSPFAQVKVFGVAYASETAEVLKIFPQARVFPRGFPRRWFRGRGLLRALTAGAPGLDAIHVHMLWDYPVLVSWLAARRAQKPLIISPHGTLMEPWRYQQFHKKIYRHFVINNIIRHTSCMHVLNQAEAEACRHLGIHCPIRVIPNGLPDEEFEQPALPEIAYQRWPVLRDCRVMLYLGRFSPEKRLDMLIKAWKKAFGPAKGEWLLAIAGAGASELEGQLRRLISDLGLEKRVLLTGFVDGEVKKSLLAAASCFVMPSLSEGFSMAILEAMAAGLPALYTEKCNLPELAAQEGGWEVGMTEADLQAGLEMVTHQTPESLAAAGKKANALGREKYKLSTITAELLKMYQDVL
jgi:glycosyltransferase involved in cell wall biosynthesis